MKIEKFLIDFRIPYVTDHKNVRTNWVGMHCPFCSGDQNYHLGYNMDEEYFSCWRCGGHATPVAVSRLAAVSTDKALTIIEEYGGMEKKRNSPRIKVSTKKLKLPGGELDLKLYHKKYLEKRGFDWEYLEEEWGIMGTGPFAKLDDGKDPPTSLNYGRRILAPIYWNDKLVSFQGRDITNRHMAKYMACPPAREQISHKHILYGIQRDWGRRGICVEGIFDAWRLGSSAFCTFGTKFTTQQLDVMVDHFDEVVILYDPEEQAQEQAKKIIKRFEPFAGKKAWTVDLDCDPGDMSQDDADALVRSLM